MANMDAPRQAYRFFLECYKEGRTFTLAELDAATGWGGQSSITYIKKKWRDFLERRPDGRYRVKLEFRRLTEQRFLEHFSQKTLLFSRYDRWRYESVVSYEFLLPLAREPELRTILDELLYRDSIENGLREISIAEIESWVDRAPTLTDDEFVCVAASEVGEMFSGYSVHHLDGRFRSRQLRTRSEAAQLLKDYDRYVIDETTASVRFLFRTKESRSDSFDVAGTPLSQEALARTRSIFIHLFAEAVVRTVKEEDEIWLVEHSDLGTRLFVWEREARLRAL